MALHARQLGPERRRQGARQHGLAHAGHVLDEQVPTRQRRHDRRGQCAGRAEQDPAQVVDQGPAESHGRPDVGGRARCGGPVRGAVEEPDVGERSRAEVPGHAHAAVGGRLGAPEVGGLHQVHVIGTFRAELNALPGPMSVTAQPGDALTPRGQNSRVLSSGTVPTARSRAANQRSRTRPGCARCRWARRRPRAATRRRRRPRRPTSRGPCRPGRRRPGWWPRSPVRPRSARPTASARAATKVGLADMPPSTAQRVDGHGRVGLGRLEEIGAPMGDALEHGPHHLGPPGAPGDAHEGAARPEVPHRGAQAEQGGHEPHVAGVRAQRPPPCPSRRRMSMMPRSSRSHSTHVPAESMTASTPQVWCPARCQATMGKVPAPPRRTKPGRSSPTHRSSIPPVPKVALASPGRVQPCPTSEACWSPAMPQMAGAPGQRARPRPPGPTSRRWRGRTDRGMRSASSMASSQSAPSAAEQPGDPGVGGVGDVQGPPDSVQATQVSTVPKHRSRVRSGSAMSRSMASLVADSLGATAMPWSRSTRQVPTVRRSCQPEAGPDGLPAGAVPHDGRGPLVGDAHPGHGAGLAAARRRPPRARRRPWPRRRTRRSPGAGDEGRTST